MKKLASEAGDKVLLRYLALYEKWRGKLLAKQIAKLLHTSRHAKVVDLLEKTGPRSTELPDKTLHWRRRNPDPKNPGAGNETEKILEAEGKRASLLREEPFFYARDSVEYKVHLMIWGTRGKSGLWRLRRLKFPECNSNDQLLYGRAGSDPVLIPVDKKSPASKVVG